MYDRLRAVGILVNVHYIPVYSHPYYRQHGHAEVCCPNAEELYAGALSLPMYPGLLPAEQNYVIGNVLQLMEELWGNRQS